MSSRPPGRLTVLGRAGRKCVANPGLTPISGAVSRNLAVCPRVCPRVCPTQRDRLRVRRVPKTVKRPRSCSPAILNTWSHRIESNRVGVSRLLQPFVFRRTLRGDPDLSQPLATLWYRADESRRERARSEERRVGKGGRHRRWPDN